MEKYLKHYRMILSLVTATVFTISALTPAYATTEGTLSGVDHDQNGISVTAESKMSDTDAGRTPVGNASRTDGEIWRRVKFYDWNGDLISEQYVRDGGAAVAPADPVRQGYEFIGWNPSKFDNIKGATGIIAEYGELSIYKVQVRFVFADEVEQSAAQPYIAVVHRGDDLNAVAPIPIFDGFEYANRPQNAADGFTIEDSQVRINLASVTQDVDFTLYYYPTTVATLKDPQTPTTNDLRSVFDKGNRFSGISPAGSAYSSFIGQAVAMGVPMLGFSDQPLPLYGVKGHKGWSLLNLLLAALTLLFSVYQLFFILFRERKVENEDMAENYKNSGGLEIRKAKCGLALLTGPLAVLVFLLTENTKQFMVVFDQWTVLMVLIFIAEVLFTLTATNRRKVDSTLLLTSIEI